MTSISKTTYTFVVLHRSDDPPTSLAHAMQESFDGGMVGSEGASPTTVTVPDEKVQDELVALGNDGGFFDLTFE